MLSEKDKSILQHILKYIERIEQNTKRFGDSEKEFLQDIAYQETEAFCLLQIGELVSHLTEDFKNTHTKIPWSQIKVLRNIVAHGYGTIDNNLVWKTIKNDVPYLLECVNQILRENVATTDKRGDAI